jgi:hypothetical protein
MRAQWVCKVWFCSANSRGLGEKPQSWRTPTRVASSSSSPVRSPDLAGVRDVSESVGHADVRESYVASRARVLEEASDNESRHIYADGSVQVERP